MPGDVRTKCAPLAVAHCGLAQNRSVLPGALLAIRWLMTAPYRAPATPPRPTPVAIPDKPSMMAEARERVRKKGLSPLVLALTASIPFFGVLVCALGSAVICRGDFGTCGDGLMPLFFAVILASPATVIGGTVLLLLGARLLFTAKARPDDASRSQRVVTTVIVAVLALPFLAILGATLWLLASISGATR